jgi:SRSO17 transposase
VLSRLPHNAPVWLDRLSEWLEPFEVCFTHIAQRGAFRRYLLGLLSDSRRKSMSAMLERVSDPGTYQSFQHFITDAPLGLIRFGGQVSSVGQFSVVVLSVAP